MNPAVRYDDFWGPKIDPSETGFSGSIKNDRFLTKTWDHFLDPLVTEIYAKSRYFGEFGVNLTPKTGKLTEMAHTVGGS